LSCRERSGLRWAPPPDMTLSIDGLSRRATPGRDHAHRFLTQRVTGVPLGSVRLLGADPASIGCYSILGPPTSRVRSDWSGVIRPSRGAARCRSLRSPSWAGSTRGALGPVSTVAPGAPVAALPRLEPSARTVRRNRGPGALSWCVPVHAPAGGVHTARRAPRSRRQSGLRGTSIDIARRCGEQHRTRRRPDPQLRALFRRSVTLASAAADSSLSA
jgi:hypothetical protein